MKSKQDANLSAGSMVCCDPVTTQIERYLINYTNLGGVPFQNISLLTTNVYKYCSQLSTCESKDENERHAVNAKSNVRELE